MGSKAVASVRSKKPPKSLPDTQQSHDHRGLAIDQVGVCDLRYPLAVLDRANRQQQTVATVSLSDMTP